MNIGCRRLIEKRLELLIYEIQGEEATLKDLFERLLDVQSRLVWKRAEQSTLKKELEEGKFS